MRRILSNSSEKLMNISPNKQLNTTSTALLRLRLNATLAQTNQLRSSGLAGRYTTEAEPH